MRLIRSVDNPVGSIHICTECRASVEVLEVKADDAESSLDRGYRCAYCIRGETADNDRSLEHVRPQHKPVARDRVPYTETPAVRWEAREPDLDLDLDGAA